jgi:hypothetical protein
MLAGGRKDVVCSACCLNTPTRTTPRQSSGGDRAVLRYYFPHEMIGQHCWFACAQMFETNIFQYSRFAAERSLFGRSVTSRRRMKIIDRFVLQQVFMLKFSFISLQL